MFEFLEDRAKEYETLVESLHLPESIKKIPDTLLGMPYHNSHHLRSVAVNAYRLALEEDPENAHIAFLAGSCHDLGYVHHDQEYDNIVNALDAYKRMAQLADFTQEEISHGSTLIANTDSTLRAPLDSQSAKYWVVRDADLSVWLGISAAEAHYLCDGLERELKIPTDIHSTREFLIAKGMGTLSAQKALDEFAQKALTVSIQDRWLMIND